MPVLGVDVGSSTSTVATILRGAIDIVLNDVSQRYTPTCVSYGDLQRIFGDQANTQIVSNFRNTCRGFLNVLGLSTSEDHWNVTELDKFFNSTAFTVDEKGHLAYQVTNGGKTTTVSALAVLTGYLSYLTELAEKYTGGVCREVVMSHPSWFSEYQKNLMVASVRATGSNCLRLISEGFAMAMDYGMYRLKQLSDETATTVALVNVGHSHTTVALVDFFASYCVVLSEVSDRDLGGRYLECMLMREMCQEFSKKYKLDPLANNKTRLKVEAVASKVKRVLSANSDSSYSLECLMEDYDLTGNVKREEFESMCSKEFLPRLSELLTTALRESGRTQDAIHSVEVVGGITRVPCIQALISTVFNKPISKTLNADESVARGCVLQGAINSKHYMVRKYNVVEKLRRPLSVSALPGLGPFTQMQKVERIVVAEVGSSKSEVYVLRVPFEPPFTVLSSFDDPRVNSRHQLPTFQYTLTAVPAPGNEGEKAEKEEGKEGEKSQSEKEEEDVEKYLNKVEKECSKNEGNKEEGVPKIDKDANGWIVKFQFDETGSLLSYCRGLDVCVVSPYKFDLEQLATNEANQRRKDMNETIRLKTLNDLETYVYAARDKLNNTHVEFVEGKVQAHMLKKLDEVENWLYENRLGTLADFEAKHNSLSTMFEPVENNYRVYTNKEQNLGNFFTRLKQIYDYAVGREGDWTNVPEGERAEVANRINGLNNTTMELVEKEKNMPKYNNPLYTMEQLEEQINLLKNEMEHLIKKYKVVEEPKSKETKSEEKKDGEEENEEMEDAEEGNRDDSEFMEAQEIP
ncbi:heat shock protein [Theileria orientalis strain Shintoku]|uniref:Heat shock protein n=1 Tax=Theileria orientalis strain Shintoku TaxID=869250 RepID=J4C376_THEOR|nr:heat shock protein [Theileria orientalis strain Shintoku]BAM39956.1 heat shock protein [Theileria orientalis strain Shintoku]|eukprot:XP_009690257.1 heat shock protein [Theileria orientalis strain Shintoku]